MFHSHCPHRYLQFWGWIFVLVTAGIAFFQPEKNFTDEEERERSKRSIENLSESHADDLEEASPRPVRSTSRKRAKAIIAEPSGPEPGVNTAEVGGGWGGPLSDIVVAYRQLLGVVSLPAVWGLSAFLLRQGRGAVAH